MHMRGRDRTTAPFLLKPGRKYEEVVKTFQPYDKVQEPYRMPAWRARR